MKSLLNKLTFWGSMDSEMLAPWCEKFWANLFQTDGQTHHMYMDSYILNIVEVLTP